MRNKSKESKRETRIPVELELSPEMDAAVESYASAKGIGVEDAANELLRAGLESFQKLTPAEQKAEVESWKASQSKKEGKA